MQFRHVAEAHHDIAIGGATHRQMVGKGILRALDEWSDPPLPGWDTIGALVDRYRAVLDVLFLQWSLSLKDGDRPTHEERIWVLRMKLSDGLGQMAH